MRRNIAVFGLLFTLGSGCTGSSGDDSSKVNHTEGEFVKTANSHLWVKVSNQEFIDDLRPIQDGSPMKVTFSSDANSRLNKIIENFHSVVLSAVPDAERESYLMPRSVIIDDDSNNAFVKPVSVCFEVNGVSSGEYYSIDRVFKEIGNSQSSCVPRSIDSTDAATLLNSYLKPMNGCQVTSADNDLRFNSGCDSYMDRRSASISKFSLDLIPDMIFFYRGMIEQFTEEDMNAVVAHELAHYYLAHPIADPDMFYPHIVEESPSPVRPTRSDRPDIAELVEELSEKLGNIPEENPSTDAITDAQVTLEKAHNMSLGWYSFEQEADEISLELLYSRGFGIETVVNARLKILASKDALYRVEPSLKPIFGFLNVHECSNLIERNFRTSEGNWERVPIGDFFDPHHTDCYRIYNAFREFEAHDYSTGEQALEPLSEDQWDRLIIDLKATFSR